MVSPMQSCNASTARRKPTRCAGDRWDPSKCSFRRNKRTIAFAISAPRYRGTRTISQRGNSGHRVTHPRRSLYRHKVQHRTVERVRSRRVAVTRRPALQSDTRVHSSMPSTRIASRSRSTRVRTRRESKRRTSSRADPRERHLHVARRGHPLPGVRGPSDDRLRWHDRWATHRLHRQYGSPNNGRPSLVRRRGPSSRRNGSLFLRDDVRRRHCRCGARFPDTPSRLAVTPEGILAYATPCMPYSGRAPADRSNSVRGDARSVAWDINEAGSVVGMLQSMSGRHYAFRWERGHLERLDDLPHPDGWRFESAYAIAPDGTILGVGTYHGVAMAFRWRPS